MKQKHTETELAKEVIDNLTLWGWEIYQEVEGPGGRCDIVAKRGKIQWAIECKLSFGFPVLEQAFNWRRYAHYSSVAVPSAPGSFSLAHKVCETQGIGILRVLFNSNQVDELLKPSLNRHGGKLKLYEEQKTFCEAGGNQGGHWTPFKRTKRELIDKVRITPGIEFNQLIKAIDHHYGTFSTAKSCLRGFIGSSVIPELRCDMVDRKLCVFMADSK